MAPYLAGETGVLHVGASTEQPRVSAGIESQSKSSELTLRLGCSDAVHVSEKVQVPVSEEGSDSRLVDNFSLLQEVSLRLCNVGQRLVTSLGFPDCCDTIVPQGIPGEILEMQCNAVRKVQIWS